MIAAILHAQFGDAVLATRGNFNNDIGLPLTLLGLNAGHRAAVIEMGMNHPGEIAYLAPIGAPDVALVTNAQRAHLEGMGDLDEVAREKGSLFGGLRANGTAVINADDCYAGTGGDGRTARGAHLCIDHAAAFRARCSSMAGNALELSAPEGSASIRLRIPGRHNARKCVAAAAPVSAAAADGRRGRRAGKLRWLKGRLHGGPATRR